MYKLLTSSGADIGGLNDESTNKRNANAELCEATEDSANAPKVKKLCDQLDDSNAEELTSTILKHDVHMDWKEKRTWICSKRTSSTVAGIKCSSCDSVEGPVIN